MRPMQANMISRLMPLVIAVVISLAAAGCASGPIGSHGVDYIPAFDTPNQWSNATRRQGILLPVRPPNHQALPSYIRMS
jgi:hypothetical protein